MKGLSLKKPPVKAVPAYRRIADGLVHQVQSGKLHPGDPVPSERDLAVQFNVSLMTARHALQALTAEGVLSRRPNVGTFVAPPRIHFNRLTSFTEETLSRGLHPETRVLSMQQRCQDEEVGSKLSLPPGTPLIRVQRLRLSNGEPFAVETCYLPAPQFSTLSSEDLEKRSLFALLRERFKVDVRYADEEIDATCADKRTGRLLQVDAGAPVLRIRQVLHDGTAPVIYSTALYRSDRHSLLIRRFR